MKKSNWLLVTVILLWGLINVMSAQILRQLSPFVHGLEHRILTSLCFLILFAVRGQLKLFRISRRALLLLAGLSLINFVSDGVYYIGISHSSPDNGAVLYRLDLIFTTLLSVILFQEKIRWYQWGLLAVMLAGMALAVFGEEIGGVQFNLYNLLFVLCALFESIFVLAVKGVNDRLERSGESVDSRVFSVMAFSLNTVLFFVFSLFSGGLPQLTLLVIDWQLGALCAGIAVLQCAMLSLYFGLLRVKSPILIKIATFFVPVTTMLFSILLLGQPVSLMKCIGVAIIIACAFAFVHSRERARKEEEHADRSSDLQRTK